MTDNVALLLDNVDKSFGKGDARVNALQNVSLTIQSGQICGLIGPDGAGKSTLMRLVSGLLLQDSGSIEVLGMNLINSALQIQTAVGYMPQHFGLYEDLTVEENLDLYADLQGVEKQSRLAIYQELMHMTALGPFRRRLAGRLSGGMKQKLGLACTLVGIPRLLILDEPTAGVDPVSRRELWTIINRLVKQEKMSVLLSTAYLDEAERCDEVVLIHEGQILGQGSPNQFSQPIRGRTFHVSSPSLSKRQLQHRLCDAEEILDAVIDNEKVRVVTREGVTIEKLNRSRALLGDDTVVNIETAKPIFEDAFIARLKQSQPASQIVVSPHSGVNVPSDNVIVVENVNKRFGTFYAVKEISFKVKRGEIFGLLGANGAGKSTTFRMLCGLLPATAGHLMVAGHDLRHAPAKARSGLGYMAQRFSLYANLTILENLRFFARIYGLNRAQRKKRIKWALDTFELSTYTNSPAGEIPLGFKQRLALATSLLHEPDILFLDEPTSGVDPLARREFWHRINALAEAGVTILVTTHFMAEADYCDRLVIMSDGEVLASGSPAELKAAFRTDALPEPGMEDTFIGLIGMRERNEKEVAA